MRLKEITDRIYEMNDREKMERANELYYCAARHLMECDPEEYDELVSKAEDIYYEYDLGWAQEKVQDMKPVGEHWAYDTIRAFVRDKGIEEKCLEYYLVMNMAKNDYGQLAAKYGQDEAQFCFDIAQKFINDEDGKPHKVAKYFGE